MTRAARALLVVLVSATFSVVAVEVTLRLSITRLPLPFLMFLNASVKDRFPATWQKLRDRSPDFWVQQEDNQAGFTYKPKLRLRGTSEDGEAFDVVTSSEGFLTPDEPPRTARQLVVIGDSFLASFSTRRPISHVLKAQLATPVYTLAVGGWGPESYLGAYRKFATGRRSDFVVVFTFLNDITDVLNWQRWQDEASGESFLTFLQRTAAAEGRNQSMSWPDRHLVLWNLVRFSLRHQAEGSSQPDEVLAGDATRREHFVGESGSFDLQFLRRQVFMERDPGSFLPGGDYYPYVQSYLESLLRLKGAVEQNHSRMVLVWIPTKERVYLPLLSRERQAFYVTNQTHDIGGIEAVLSRFAAAEGISYLDLTAPLQQRAAAGEKLYFTIDGHFNSLGQEAVGAIVSTFLQRLPTTAPAPDSSAGPLYLRPWPVPVEQPIRLSDAASRSALATQTNDGIQVRGRAESRFAYIAKWPESNVERTQWLMTKGVVRRGGVTVGVLQNDRWAAQVNITTHGRFDVALPVEPGRYAVLLAHDLPENALENDVEITSFGWSTIRQ